MDNSGAGSGRPVRSGDRPAAPLNRLWREHEAALIARFGPDTWDRYLSQVVPVGDDGHVYTLACGSAAMGLYISDYLEGAAEVIGRREIFLVVRDWVNAAIKAERERIGAAEEAAQRYARPEERAAPAKRRPAKGGGDDSLSGLVGEDLGDGDDWFTL